MIHEIGVCVRGRGHIGNTAKEHISLQLSFIILGFGQAKSIIIMCKEWSNKILNFITPGAGFFVLGCRDSRYIAFCS